MLNFIWIICGLIVYGIEIVGIITMVLFVGSLSLYILRMGMKL